MDFFSSSTTYPAPKALGITVGPPPTQYAYLYKQWKVKKIVVYLRLTDVPHTNPISASIDSSYINAIEMPKFTAEVIVKANPQPDVLFNRQEILQDPYRVTLTTKQTRFSAPPLEKSQWGKFVDPNTSTATQRNTTVRMQWKDVSDNTAYVYKYADFFNASRVVVPSGRVMSTPNIPFMVEACWTIVYQFRWKKSLATFDQTGGQDPVSATNLVTAPGGFPIAPPVGVESVMLGPLTNMNS